MSGYSTVSIEMKVRGIWQPLASNSEVEPAGSISNEEHDGRQVYVFGWHEGEGPCVWKSLGGADFGNDAIRSIASVGLEKIATLSDGPYEMDFCRNGQSMPIRFRSVMAAP